MSAQTPGEGRPAAKRRRVELANSTLKKPFRSPVIKRDAATATPSSSRPSGPAVVSSGVGSRTGTGPEVGTSPVVGIGDAAVGSAASPSLRLRQGQGLVQQAGRSSGSGSGLGVGLGLGQSPLRFKTRIGEDGAREIPDSEDEVENESSEDDHDNENPGNDGEEGKDGKDNDMVTRSADLSTSFQIPASPSLRTAAGGAGSGKGQDGKVKDMEKSHGLNLEGRRYPSPFGSTLTSTPARTTATPGRALPLQSSARNGTSISYQSRNYDQTPIKKSTISSSSLLATGSRNPKTPSTHRLTNRATTNHNKDRTQNEENQLDEESDMSGSFQAANKELQAHMSEIRKQLDIARQARRIQEKGSIQELEALIEKWKGASRQAAEDLFELIKQRVDSMGGGKAWRDSRRRQQQGWSGFGDDEDYKRQMKNKRDGDYDEYGEGTEGDEEHEDDGEDDEGNNEEEEDMGFTMAMMLQSLNIEPEVLGWDPGEEKWRD